MAVERHITEGDAFFLGEDKSLPVTVYQSDGSTAQNITGWSISFMLKKKQTDSDAAAKITKTTASGITLTTPASGLLTISIADTDTDSLAADTYWYEVKRTDAGFESILTYGTCQLLQSVHRS